MEKSFLEQPQLQKVKVLSEDPQEGPDGFPYLMLSTEDGAAEPFLNVVKWCGDRGVGIAINPQKENPDLVLPYGMLWNYLLRGEFLTQQDAQSSLGKISMEGETTLYSGEPSEAYWPGTARKIFKEFLLQQGVVNAKILLLSDKPEGPMDLTFSVESLGNPQQSEWDGILEAFSWFFPRHYSLALLSEKNVTGLQFSSL